MSEQQPRDVVASLQGLINLLSGYPVIKADGVLGSRTYDAFQALPSSTVSLLYPIIDDSPFLRDRMAKQAKKKAGSAAQSADGPSFYPISRVKAAAHKASERTGAPLSYLLKMISFENLTTDAGVWVEHAGTFRGVAQFNARTWESVRTRYPDARLPAFEIGSSDLNVSLTAAGLLWVENKKSFSRVFRNREFFDEIGYLYHQQGSSAAAKFLKTGALVYPKQSATSVEEFNQARIAFVRGRPHRSVAPHPEWVA